LCKVSKITFFWVAAGHELRGTLAP
jgi:hypothetical protein